MTDEQYKAIMAELGQPHSHSLLAALRQVANEVAQEVQAAENELCAKVCEALEDAFSDSRRDPAEFAAAIRSLRA